MTTCPDCQHTFDPTVVPGGHCPRCRFMGGAHEAESLQAPLPDCEIVDLIAHGGMGDVYRATQPTLERELAVKVMTGHAATPELAARFRREALVLARLQHPNIVPIHALGTDEDGQPYYTMKLVKGRTLQAILDDLRQGNTETLRQHSLAQLLNAFRKVCDALAFAHAQGVLHRDLKPDNIMIGEFGEVLVMDWGLARIRDKETGRWGEEETSESAISRSPSLPVSLSFVTLAGAVLGTPKYMSPEQAAGQVSELDERSDIYSLGAVLYAILTLRPPVEGQTVQEVLEKVKTGSIMSLAQGAGLAKSRPVQERHLASAAPWPIPASLSAVAMKALALDKAKRYPSVAALIADVEAYQGGFATAAENAGAWKQLLLLMGRHRTVTASLAVLLVFSIGFVLKLMSSERRAITGEALAIQEKQAARQSSARANLNLAEAALREGNGLEMLAALSDVPEDLRDSTWSYLLAQSDTSIARIPTGGTEIVSVAAHPRRPGVFAVADGKGKITVLEVRTGKRLLEFQTGFDSKSATLRIAISADGERIAVGREDDEGGIILHDAKDGKKLAAWAAPLTKRLEFSPDGQSLLQTESRKDSLQMWDPATGKRRWSYQAKSNYNVGAFTPDGQVLLFSQRDKLRLVNALDGSLVRPISQQWIESFAIHPQGKMVVAVLHHGGIQGISLEDNRALFEVYPPKSRFNAQKWDDGYLAFTPDGQRFVSVTMLEDGRQALQVWNASTGAPHQSLLGSRGRVKAIGLHPLSSELLVGGDNTAVWSLAETPAKWSFPTEEHLRFTFWGLDDVVFAPSSPKGDALMKLQGDSHTVLWEPPGNGAYLASTSADSRFGILAHRHRNTKNDASVFFLRQPGSPPEPVVCRGSTSNLSDLRLGPNGDRWATVQKFHTEVVVYDGTPGPPPARLDLSEMVWFWDLGWLSSQRLVGLATAKAERGNPLAEERIVLWDTATGQIVQTATNHTTMNVLAVAPDGRRFAEAGANKCVRIRDASTLAVVQEFRAHDGAITALAWHPTQPILATASDDLSVKLWNLDTGKRLRELRGCMNTPTSLHFSPTGKRLACVSANDAVRIWELEATTAPAPARSPP